MTKMNFISPALWIKDVSLDGQRMDKPIDGWKNARIVGLMDNCIMRQIKKINKTFHQFCRWTNGYKDKDYNS